MGYSVILKLKYLAFDNVWKCIFIGCPLSSIIRNIPKRLSFLDVISNFASNGLGKFFYSIVLNFIEVYTIIFNFTKGMEGLW
jgi:hypothetical protein